MTHHDSLVVIWIQNAPRLVDSMDDVFVLGRGKLEKTIWLKRSAR